MSNTQLENIVIRWWQAETFLKNDKTQQEAKQQRASIKQCKALLVRHMLDQQTDTIETSKGWLVIKKNKSKLPRNDEFLKAVFIEFHKKQTTEDSLEVVAEKFIGFLRVCQDQTSTERFTVLLQNQQPLSVYLRNCSSLQ
jgi:hypothetical protein